MKILAFDLGSNMAVAHNLFGPTDIRVEHKWFKGTRQQRAGATWIWLHDLFDQAGEVDAVVYERPFVRGQDATRSLWGLAGLIEARASVDGVLCLDYSPKEIKLHSTGHGNAGKEDMILAAAMTGYLGDNEHEADAWCLLRYAEYDLKPARPKKVKK